jgi:methionyl-tRNA formyltransferase
VTERARTVFFGSGAFAVPILTALSGDPNVDLVAVVSAPDRPAGRHGMLTAVPVVKTAREIGLALLQPPRVRAPESAAAIAALRPRLGVLADYGQIVPPGVLDIFPGGILNVHPSRLPRHRGATPIPNTILAGDPVAGVTVIRMDAGLDTGPIVAAVDWPLAGTETAPELEATAARFGAELLETTLGGWLDGSLVVRPQDDAAATLTRPLRRKDGRLDPAQGAAELSRQVRAFQPWPGSFVEVDGQRILVWTAEVAPEGAGDAPGRLEPDDGGLALTTATGRLRLLVVQPAGGRRMSGADLLRGRPGLAGTAVTWVLPSRRPMRQ